MDDVAQLMAALLRIVSDVLAFLNPLRVTAPFDTEAFAGGVALAAACICGAMSYRIVERIAGYGRGPIIAAGCMGFLCAAGLFRMQSDARGTAEAICFSMAGVFRVLDGVGLVNAVATLLGRRPIRKEAMESRDFAHPLALLFTALQVLIYTQYVRPQTTLDWVTVGVSCVASFLSYAGMVALVRVIARDSALHPPAAPLALGLCLVVWLSTAYVPVTPLPRTFFMLAYPAGVVLGLLFRASRW